MDDLSTGSESEYANWFLSTRGNEYCVFTTLLNALTTAVCEIEDEFILDRFNLTGLNSEVHHYAQALDVITDNMEDDLNDELRDGIESSARHLYGLIHARFILTSRGLSKMVDKFRKADFGRCPRVLCYGQALLPVGLSDIPYQKAVKLYCPRCEDIYSPKSTRHGAIDGAYFGSTFPHMLFMVYPNLIPTKSVPAGSGGLGAIAGPSGSSGLGSGAQGSNSSATTGAQPGGPAAASKAERYRPRVFGFQLRETARLQRWQEAHRDSQVSRLEGLAANGTID